MSAVHDIFIATDDELAEVDVEWGVWPALESPSQERHGTATTRRWWQRGRAEPRPTAAPRTEPLHPTVDAKGTGDIPLVTLEMLLAGERIDDVDLVSDPIRVGDLEEGPWLFGVNERLVRRLADAHEGQVAEIVGPWVATEEMHGWSEDDALTLLVELADLFRRAQAEHKRVFRWTSL